MDGRKAMLCTGGRYCCDVAACCCCCCDSGCSFSFGGCNDDERNVDPKNCINDSIGFCGWSVVGWVVDAADNEDDDDDDDEDGVEIWEC